MLAMSVVKALAGLTAVLAACAMAAPASPLDIEQRGSRIGQQRGAGPGRAGVPRSGRRGNREGRGTDSRIQQRSYVFPETGDTIEYAVFVSSKVDADKPSPLVIALHGLGVQPVAWLQKLTGAAQDAGYIAAAPMGYDVRGWYGANGPTSGRASPSNVGELSEKDVMNVLALMRQEFNIDSRRIYLAGQSMGGAGALFLGIKHKDIWAAVAASAPAIRTNFQNPDDLERAAGLPMMLIHGDADRAVPVEQTRRWVEKMKALNMTYEYRELRGVGHDAIAPAARDIFKFFDKHVK
jgi:predicted peptidase